MKRLDNLSVPTPEAIVAASSPKVKARLVNRGVDLGRGLKRADDFSRREVPEGIHISEQLVEDVAAVEIMQGLSRLGSSYGLEEAFDRIEAEESSPAPEDWTSIRPDDVTTDMEMAEAWGIPVDVVRGVNQEHDVFQASIQSKKAKVMPRSEEKPKAMGGDVVPLVSGRGIKDSVRTIGHAVSSVRNAVRPSGALEREARRRAAELAREDFAISQLNEVFGAEYAAREEYSDDEAERRAEDPYAYFARVSSAVVGDEAILRDDIVDKVRDGSRKVVVSLADRRAAEEAEEDAAWRA